jgi:hypothetical protein
MNDMNISNSMSLNILGSSDTLQHILPIVLSEINQSQ